MVKKYRVIVLPQAQEGLRQQLAYLRRTQNASEQQIKRVRRVIMETIRSLKTMPEKNEKLHEICDEQTVYHRAFKWDYRIIYTINEEQVTVLVVDIDHVADDPRKLLDKFKDE
ncbi:MAG: type II toxin-antitoxin system RelE/ParE family toxin [Bacteroidota bacterium]